MKIRHDVHNHTLLSSCCYDPEATIEAYCRRAKELGHTVFGVSNHLWDEKVPGASHWYHQQMINYGLEGSREVIPKDIEGVKFLIGSESEYCGMTDTLGMTAETAKRFDYMLIPHTHMHMKGFVIAEAPDVKEKRRELAERFAAQNPDIRPDLCTKMANSIAYAEIEAMIPERKIDIVQYNADFMVSSFHSLMANEEFKKLAATVPTSVAHPFCPCGFGLDMNQKMVDYITDERFAECFEEAKALNVSIEINTGAVCHTADDFAHEPAIRWLRIAREVGCTFTFGTDTHSLSGLDNIVIGDRVSELCDITEDNLAPYVKG